MMCLKPIIVAGALVLATSAYAQGLGNRPYSNPNPPPGVTSPAVQPVQPGVRQPPMRGRNSSMPRGTGTNTFQGGPNNSTGNMNNRGAGFGTTGTGGPGGSGNR
jgi:hypothetical protein